MLTALPPNAVTAIEDDRPIVIGRIDRPDFYVMAHEAKNRGDDWLADDLLKLSAYQLGVAWEPGDVFTTDWDLNIEAIDEAWGKAQGGHGD